MNEQNELTENIGTTQHTARARKNTKLVAGVVISVGVGTVVGVLSRKYIPWEEMRKHKKVLAKVGVFAISGAVANFATKQAEEDIDSFYNAVDEAIDLVNQEKTKEAALTAVADYTTQDSKGDN